jgi:Ribbon-helix-helix protein, copG family
MQEKRRKVPMNITIDPAVIDLISTEAERQERSRSWIIEWAVKKALDLSQQPKPAQPFYVLPPSIGEIPVVTCNPVPLTDLQRIEDAKAGRYRGQSDIEELPVGMTRTLKGLPE